MTLDPNRDVPWWVFVVIGVALAALVVGTIVVVNP